MCSDAGVMRIAFGIVSLFPGGGLQRDCLKLAEQTIVDVNLLDAATLREWRKDAAAQVDQAISTAQKEAAPEADEEDWCAISTRDLVDPLE